MDFVHSYCKFKCFALIQADCEAVKFIIATYEIRGKKKERKTTADLSGVVYEDGAVEFKYLFLNVSEVYIIDIHLGV